MMNTDPDHNLSTGHGIWVKNGDHEYGVTFVHFLSNGVTRKGKELLLIRLRRPMCGRALPFRPLTLPCWGYAPSSSGKYGSEKDNEPLLLRLCRQMCGRALPFRHLPNSSGLRPFGLSLFLNPCLSAFICGPNPCTHLHPRQNQHPASSILSLNHNRLPKPQLLQPRQLRLRITHHQPDHPISVNILRRQLPYLLHRHPFNNLLTLFHVVILPTILAYIVEHPELRFSSFKRPRVALNQSAFSGLQIGGRECFRILVQD